MNKKRLSNLHEQIFAKEPEVISSAPGRINILGEHVDYNHGFVLPAAINLRTFVSLSKRNDDTIRLYSVLYKEKFEIDLEKLHPVEISWVNYILGVGSEIKKRNSELSGFDLCVAGNIPSGSGLSSSAALTCSVAMGLNELFDLNLSKREIAHTARMAEHNYLGVFCGIMDQFASVFGKENHLMKLDCRDESFEYIPLNLPNQEFILLNTNVKHSLADSAYNERKMTCEKALKLLSRKYNNIHSFRDIQSLSQIESLKESSLIPKAKYVFEEIQRTEEACTALKKGDLKRLGQLMYQTHKGLREEYEVSCDELDFLVDFTKQFSQIYGARMMGGGFGGCTLNLMEKDFVEEFIARIQPIYRKEFDKGLTVIRVKPSEGAKIL